jgi:hypothetical protein
MAVSLRRDFDKPSFWRAYLRGPPSLPLYFGAVRAADALRGLGDKCRGHGMLDLADWLEHKADIETCTREVEQ